MGKLMASRVRYLLLSALLLALTLLVPTKALAAGGSISVNPSSGPAGQMVTIIGTGWYEHASRGLDVPIWIGFANVVGTGHPDSNGNFSVSITIPVTPPPQEIVNGKLTISAIIGNGGSADAFYTIGPSQSPPSYNFSFDVDSTKGWQSTSLKVTKGQQLSFSAVGSWTVDFRNFPNVSPDGYSPDVDRTIYQGCKLDSIHPYGVLLVRIGDDDPTFIAIGSKGEFPAYREGFLEFRIHDGDACLVDNAGSVHVTVTAPLLILRQPAGLASNLVVLVHGCCTDANDVRKDWDSFGRLIAGTIQTPGAWEVVVWDWTTDYTTIPPTPLTPKDADFISNALTAHGNAPTQGQKLATAILNVKQPYKYVHLIAHSAGSNLIDTVKDEIHLKSVTTGNKPFIHLTFLDAFTPHGNEKFYGCSSDYAEHYVDRGLAFTDSNLSCAFNFDITNWMPDKDDRQFEFGHQWPIRWYEKSVTSHWYTDYGFRYGYPLSFEWGNNRFNTLPTEFPIGQCIKLNRVTETAKCD